MIHPCLEKCHMYNISENKTKQERWYVLLKEKLKNIAVTLFTECRSGSGRQVYPHMPWVITLCHSSPQINHFFTMVTSHRILALEPQVV